MEILATADRFVLILMHLLFISKSKKVLLQIVFQLFPLLLFLANYLPISQRVEVSKKNQDLKRKMEKPKYKKMSPEVSCSPCLSQNWKLHFWIYNSSIDFNLCFAMLDLILGVENLSNKNLWKSASLGC